VYKCKHELLKFATANNIMCQHWYSYEPTKKLYHLSWRNTATDQNWLLKHAAFHFSLNLLWHF